MTEMRDSRRIRVRGLVQGVGFRPFIWRLAHECGLTGHVLNDGEGVEIAVWGEQNALESFMRRIAGEAPPLSRVDEITAQPMDGSAPSAFEIVDSAQTEIDTGIVPDAATCPACRDEIFDPANRRFGYAFTNCTHCGPRLSIISAIPYDRAKTSMRAFAMCPACGSEYADPSDRRFHAQPNACPVCGPMVWIEDAAGIHIDVADPIAEAARRLMAGEIGAIKGIGGFHLACDATSAAAVAELRRRKHRPSKPLALMARDVDEVRRYARASETEAALLRSSAAPIVLLEMAGKALTPGVAPDQRRVGFMLAYSPLHHLLMADLDCPIVLTSGNLSEEPQATDNAEARARLGGIADFFLQNDRDIVNRLDDSVMRVDAPAVQVLRRGRGLAPASLRLAAEFGSGSRMLAMGGGLKSAFCLLRGAEAVLSQHMGDLENAATYADYRRSLDLYRALYRFTPDAIAVDLHPDYLSTRAGEALAEELGIGIVRVQHHHAHLASCLADNGVAPGEDETIGIVLDGLGLGTDGTIWGGEILVGGYSGFSRTGHFDAVPQPGGDRAQREPWRNLVAHLHAAFGPDWRGRVSGMPLGTALAEKPLDLIATAMARGVNAPLSSSAGRLFDAAAAALGICRDRQDFEGQAAMALEALATPFSRGTDAYPVELVHGEPHRIAWAPLWQALLADLARGTEPGLIAARFHHALADGIATLVQAIARETGIGKAALSGGVMQNRLLFDLLFARLSAAGLTVLVQRHAPANDGGLALGQAAIAALSG
ncbi:MAG: carbamoyltransferase HypF [Alphaproteobacteria bacterium]|nr:carbamoyltransferase HypF [Alphaproteobacteria bacterium]